jgi:hypothetical protein
MTVNLRKLATYEAGNLESAAIVLAAVERFGGEGR